MTKNNHFSPAFEKGHFNGLVDEGEYLRQSSLYKQILPRTPSRPKPPMISLAKNLFNQHNPRLVNDLRLFKALYICRDSSTDAERSLQIAPFLTNKANFRKSQMNIKPVITREYDKMDTWSSGKNKAKTKPIQSQNKPNAKPIQSQYKANTKPKQTQCLSAISVAGQRQNNAAEFDD